MFPAARRLVRVLRALGSDIRRSWCFESPADRSPLSLATSVIWGGARGAVPPRPVGPQAHPDEAADEHDSG